LLDEVDSFLMDRRQAEHSWEHTQVNELLQQMERYPGIFIAATNLMGGLDPAALRRFDFKLHFSALTPDQRRGLFAREALGDEQAPLPPAWERYLAALPGLSRGTLPPSAGNGNCWGRRRRRSSFCGGWRRLVA
jgi:AAA+ superfamily predicted ATPase